LARSTSANVISDAASAFASVAEPAVGIVSKEEYVEAGTSGRNKSASRDGGSPFVGTYIPCVLGEELVMAFQILYAMLPFTTSVSLSSSTILAPACAARTGAERG
jgi:hypothetical protein